MRIFQNLMILVLTLFFSLSPAASTERKKSQDYRTFTLYLENDLFSGSGNDRQYTNGIKLTLISRELERFLNDPLIPGWGRAFIEGLPIGNRPGDQRRISFSLGQSIYTPDDIKTSKLITDDRPYAGLTYLVIALHGKNINRKDNLEFDLGVVGPHSYAEKTQNLVHEIVGSPKPMGWEHQLADEPIVNLFYERKWRFRQLDLGGDWSADFIPYLGGSVGNAWTGLNLGGQVRLGWHLPNDFGTFFIRPGSDNNSPLDESDPRLAETYHRRGAHIFAGLEGSYVARNILLDGNTFCDSHSVNKKPLLGHFMIGFGLFFERFKISYAYVFQTKAFDNQQEGQLYGSVTLSYSF